MHNNTNNRSGVKFEIDLSLSYRLHGRKPNVKTGMNKPALTKIKIQILKTHVQEW